MTSLHAELDRLADETGLERLTEPASNALDIAVHERDTHEPERERLEHLLHVVEDHHASVAEELAAMRAELAAHTALPNSLHSAAEEGGAPLTAATEELKEATEALEETARQGLIGSSAATEAREIQEAVAELPEETAREVETVVQGEPPADEPVARRERRASRPRSRLLRGRRAR